MSIYHIYFWNINGLTAATNNVLTDWLVATDIDILCLQEIKTQADQFPGDLMDQSYHCAVHSAHRYRYSGVATLSSETPSTICRSMGQEEFDCEGRLLMTRFPEFVLFNVYFPSGRKDKHRLDYKMRFYHRFQQICEKILDKNLPIVICGDLNTAHTPQDLGRPGVNSQYSGFLPRERQWIDTFLSLGFVDSFRHVNGDGEGDYTWWTTRSQTARADNIGWRLDYCLVSKDLTDNLTNATIHQQVTGSDHCPISLTLEF